MSEVYIIFSFFKRLSALLIVFGLTQYFLAYSLILGNGVLPFMRFENMSILISSAILWYLYCLAYELLFIFSIRLIIFE